MVRSKQVKRLLSITVLSLLPIQSLADDARQSWIATHTLTIQMPAGGLQARKAPRQDLIRVSEPGGFVIGHKNRPGVQGWPYAHRNGFRERNYRVKRYGYKKTRLPRDCQRTIITPRGERYAYSSRCLKRNYKHVRHLPRNCAINVQTKRGDVSPFYVERCLKRDGWRVAKR